MTLKSEKYCITRENILVHELIGLQARVVNSSDAKKINLEGKIVDESKNIFIIETKNGEKKIAKAECEFEFIIGDEKVRVEGKKIACTPEMRVKNLR